MCDERIGEHLQIHTDVIGTETTKHIQRENWAVGAYSGNDAGAGERKAFL